MVAQSKAGLPDHYLSSMIMMGVLYFIFGFVTWLNSSLILFVKVGFNLGNVGAFLIPMSFYLACFFLALPAAPLLRRTGMKHGMVVGLLIMAVGALLFAAFMGMYNYVGSLVAMFVFGGGLCLLQMAVNPYVSILGPIESGAKRVALMGICNKAAGGIAPYAFGALLLGGATAYAARINAATDPAAREMLQHAFVTRAVVPYVVMAVILVLVAAWVLKSSLPEIKPEKQSGGSASRGSILRYPHLLLGAVCLFIYVGLEVMVGDGIVIYGQSMGFTIDQAKHLTSWVMGAMLVGYLLGAALTPRRFSQQGYLAFSAVLGIVFTICAWLTSGYVSVVFVALLGFANAMMWPAIFPLAIKGLGTFTAFGSALLIMGIAGGGVLPQAFTHLEKVIDFQLAFMLVMVPGYVLILYYGLHGHQLGFSKEERQASATIAGAGAH